MVVCHLNGGDATFNIIEKQVLYWLEYLFRKLFPLTLQRCIFVIQMHISLFLTFNNIAKLFIYV